MAMPPINLTEGRLADFLRELRSSGGSSGNQRLRDRLGWDENLYWRAQGRLIEDGKISPGRGYGGTVRLTDAQQEVAEAQTTAPSHISVAVETERSSYTPLKEAIESRWIKRFGYHEECVAETHSRGSKETGGTFTRPDITALGIRRYIYLAKRLEIVTFEVKTAQSVTILGVLEAIAHREAAHRSYVIYSASTSQFHSAKEVERIIELGQKYGIGIVLAESQSSVDKWEILLESIRHEPDPGRLDRFLGDLPSDELKQKLSLWK